MSLASTAIDGMHNIMHQATVLISAILVYCSLPDVHARHCSGTPGISWPGNPILASDGTNFQVTESKIDCCRLCHKNDICVGWTFHLANKQCYLKNKLGAVKTWPKDRKVWSGESKQCVSTLGISWPGNDILTSTGAKSTLLESKGECCALCEDTEECVAWVYHVENKKCFIKNKISKIHKTWDKGYEVYGGVSERCPNILHLSRPGNDIKTSSGKPSVELKTKRKCCEHCELTDGCVGWVYHDNNKCYLKSALGDEKQWPFDGKKVWAGIL